MKLTITTNQLQERIAKIEQERDQFVANANQQIAAMNGQIQLLNGLISEAQAQNEAEKEVEKKKGE